MARTKRVKGPALNRIHNRVESLIEKYIVDVPEEKKKAARKELRAFALDAIKMAAEGATAEAMKGMKQ